MVASELVTMVDLAHSFNGKLLPVPVFVDDEGVEAIVVVHEVILRAETDQF